LASETPLISISQTYEYARLGWDVLADDPHVRLAVITIWQDCKLICVWPLFTRSNGLWTTAGHLGCGTDEEYAAPLTSPGVDEAPLAALVLQSAKSIADLLKVCNISSTSALALTIANDPSECQVETKICWGASVGNITDFHGWMEKRSKILRKELRHDRRKLANLGSLQSVVITGADDSDAFVNWVFDTKIGWLDFKGIVKNWMRSARSRNFFLALMSQSRGHGSCGGALGIGLTLDGKFIAASICLLGGQRAEGFIIAFDPSFSAYSPGNLLAEDCVRYASQLGLDFDLRMGPSAYKTRWADQTEAVSSFQIVCSARGRLAFLAARFHRLARPILLRPKPAYLCLKRRGSNAPAAAFR
jgi:CelD/BcsL family acetyltransferase involved in cellulose biosynthesis